MRLLSRNNPAISKFRVISKSSGYFEIGGFWNEKLFRNNSNGNRRTSNRVDIPSNMKWWIFAIERLHRDCNMGAGSNVRFGIPDWYRSCESGMEKAYPCSLWQPAFFDFRQLQTQILHFKPKRRLEKPHIRGYTDPRRTQHWRLFRSQKVSGKLNGQYLGIRFSDHEMPGAKLQRSAFGSKVCR
jgi:hypothetical protein